MPEEEFRAERVRAHQLHELRRRVLRDDDAALYQPDARDEEATSVHFGGFLGARLVVSASFFPSSAPMNPSLTSYQLRYMATDFDVQGHGYGARVLEVAEAQLRSMGVEQIWANGRDTALGFYRCVGWKILEGSEHLSAETQLPHTVIFKQLTVSDGLSS